MKQAAVGILGGGQLGLMFAQAAQNYGLSVYALSPEQNPIIARAAQHLFGAYTDFELLGRLAEQVSAASLEFENIPVAALEFLAEHLPVRPGVQALKVAQDRCLEKQFFRDIARIPTTRFAVLKQAEDLAELHNFTFPAVLKTARDGYDGKGQVKVMSWSGLANAWASLQQVPCILEAFVDFQEELSVIIARGVAGDTAMYGPFLNEHEQHILATSWSGVIWPDSLKAQAYEIAHTVAEKLDYVGVLCIELFRNGDQLTVNEMAPRPHNSGHLTIESYTASQFEQQVRATLGLPIAPARQRSPAAMLNLVGIEPTPVQYQALLRLPGLHWHWYGKDGVQHGRKVGHITLEASDFKQLQELVAQARSILKKTAYAVDKPVK